MRLKLATLLDQEYLPKLPKKKHCSKIGTKITYSHKLKKRDYILTFYHYLKKSYSDLIPHFDIGSSIENGRPRDNDI